MLGLLTFTIFNFFDGNIFRGIIFRKEFSLFSKMVQATTSPFSENGPANPAQCHAISKKKSKPLNGLSPESGKRKKVNIQRLSPRFRSQQFFLSEICG